MSTEDGTVTGTYDAVFDGRRALGAERINGVAQVGSVLRAASKEEATEWAFAMAEKYYVNVIIHNTTTDVEVEVRVVAGKRMIRKL